MEKLHAGRDLTDDLLRRAALQIYEFPVNKAPKPDLRVAEVIASYSLLMSKKLMSVSKEPM